MLIAGNVLVATIEAREPPREPQRPEAVEGTDHRFTDALTVPGIAMSSRKEKILGDPWVLNCVCVCLFIFFNHIALADSLGGHRTGGFPKILHMMQSMFAYGSGF